MSAANYTAYWRTVPLALPKGLAAIAGLWAFINLPALNGRPTPYHRQLSKSEFNATPNEYLQHPEHNQVAFPKVPGQARVHDGLTELHHKAAHKGGHHH